MPYILINGQWYYTSSASTADEARAEGFSVSDSLPSGSSSSGGGVSVDPDLPLKQWMLKYLLDTGQLGVNQGQLGVNQFTAQANAQNNAQQNWNSLLGTLLPAYFQARGPANLAQYANLMQGQPNSDIPAFLKAAAGLTGDTGYGLLPGGGVQPQTFADLNIPQRPQHSRAADAMTQAVNGGAADGSQGAQAGQQGASTSAGASTQQGMDWGPTDNAGRKPTRVEQLPDGSVRTYYDYGGSYHQTYAPGSAVASDYARAKAADPTFGGWANRPASTTQQGGFAQAVTAGQTSSGPHATDLAAHGDLSGVSNRGDSEIAHVNKSHNLIRQHGYGTGSDARNAAHKAAGMSGEEFDRLVKRGKDPFKQAKQAGMATGGALLTNAAAGIPAQDDVVRVASGPQTVHVGEGGKDELLIVVPLERNQPIPDWALKLADRLSADKDKQRGRGGTYDSAVPGAAAGVVPSPLHLAGGGIVRVIDAGGTITSANKPWNPKEVKKGATPIYTNAAGQVQAPSNKAGKYRTIPFIQESPYPQAQNAGASVMARIFATPSLRDAFYSSLSAKGVNPEDWGAVWANGLRMIGGGAPTGARLGRAV